MPEYSHPSVREICTLLACADSAALICHVRPDGDTLGSAYALASILRALGKRADCVCADPVPEYLAFLPSEPPLTPEEAAKNEYGITVALDAASPAQLGRSYDLLAGRISLCIDHHENGSEYTNTYVRPEAAAVGEIIFDIWEELSGRGLIGSMPDYTAFALYTSICSDTGCFKYSNVTPKTHIYASRLLAFGAPSAKIAKLLFDTKSPITMKAEAIAQRSLRLLCGGRFSVAALSIAEMEGIPYQYFETAVDIARVVRGSCVAAAIKEQTPGVYRISIRSDGAVNVADICARFGGGGHACAAGASVNAASPDEAVSAVEREVCEALKSI